MRMMASLGARIFGSSTSSNRTSCGPCKTAPFISFLPCLSVLLVGDLLHPVHDPAVELFLDRDVRHGGRRRGAVPVFLVRRTPHDVAGTNDMQGPALALHVAAAGRADQRLAKRMRVPVAARARLERHVSPARARWRRCLEELVDAHRASEILRRSAGRWLRSVLSQFHKFLRST